MSTEVEDLIPHRYPFLFVEEIVEASQDRIVGRRTYSADEPFFVGHFPEYPVVPGVILVESMAQCGGAGVNRLGLIGDKLFFLATVSNAKFRRQVRPGETVEMTIENIRISSRMVRQRGTASVDGEVAAEAEWMCLVGDPPES